MSHFHLTHTHTREHTPDYDTHHLQPVHHKDSKYSRRITLSDDSDDGHDDYPYSSSQKLQRTSHTLALRNQPSQLERFNIWSDIDRRDAQSDDEDARRRSYERRTVYKYTTTTPTHRHYSKDKDDVYESDGRDFQLKIQAEFTRPKPSQDYHPQHLHLHHHETTDIWPTDVVHRKEKWVDEDWEMRERSLLRAWRRESDFWGDETEGKATEKNIWRRYHKVKSMKTEKLVPLSGWRRSKIVFGS
ncbi:hypothetical protein IAQ61_009631 [Plenodomus lingam]|uniref:Uncharacterized protein n=1 Tax=Leptosphaeria maculans (strain JN3 / isolate v23.1.3 / race Av1-4-5-6-7-8) TaxID=985895 RepID=E4ZSU1_LEPMJ|nr:hypothetical protein LEMA_P120200.1 [Plenodomus lingam JN3]KAH9863354.1 hypothetical protein IAQ61_009631 [Plenodomus lingam]CBX94529.1 hypothetical protein LEMA_P120200.1 [Plenodomus lingam JN3]